ncbi:MAG: tetratricopeptide repeat protein [Hyphomicrobiales bacterium]|nr:tetratricopeptide repeat protein [Hyphomicrobiales bacterium]
MCAIILKSVLLVAVFVLNVATAHAETRADCAQERDPQLAIRACTQLIRSQPGHAQHYINRGWSYYSAGNDKAALSDALRAIKLNPKSSEAFRLHGRVLLSMREFEKAEQAFSAAIKLAPRDPRGYVGRGDALSQRDRGLEAEADYSRALELDPGHVEAWLARGRVRLTWQGFKDALSDFTRALELRPGNAEAHDLRAWALHHLGRLDEALSEVERALMRADSGATTASALETRAHVLQGLGRFDEAAADARKALSLDPDLEQARALLAYLEGARVPSAGGACTAGTRDVDPRYAGLTVSIDPGVARVGEPVTVTWSLGDGRRDHARPAYVMIVLPEEVRFEGDGFFALTPAAQGPFGIAFGAGRMRAIVPLHTRFANRAGRMQVLPYRAGPLAIEWAVVGVDGCGEWTVGAGRSDPIAIGAGAPRLVLHDEFGNRQVRSATRSLDGRYRALSFGDLIQVVEEATGEVVLQREGRAPVFSPTGRFVTVEAPAAESIDVFDLTARRAIGRFASVSTLFWSHGDSFLFVGGQRDAWLQIVRNLHGRRYDLRSALRPEGQTWMQADDETIKRASSVFDLVPGAAGGSFTDAAERWVLELSVERGIVALKIVDDDGEDREPAAEGNGDAADSREMLARVMDLGRSHPDLAFEHIKEAVAAIEPGFGGGPPALHAWNVHGPLRLARIDTESTLQTAMRARPVVLPNDTALEPTTAVIAAAAQTSPASRRSIASTDFSGAALASASEAMMAQFGHLPHRQIDGYRAGRDEAAMQRVQAEISVLYSSSIARFGVDVSDRYGTAPFPDPDPPSPPEEIAELDLGAPGRDLWRFTIGEATYWLTQTVNSGRSGHVFDVSLLASERAGERRRHAALLQAANAHHVARFGLPADSEPLDMFQLGDVRTELDSAFGSMSIVGVSGERHLALMSRPVPRLIVFDLLDWRVTCTVANPLDGTAAISVIVHADGRHVTQINRDGAIHVYACESGATVLSGAYVDDELVVMDRHGYFDGSEDAAAYIELTLAGLPGRHLLSQFESALRRPGVAAEVLAGRPPTHGPALFAPPVVRITGAGVEAFGPSGLRYVQLFADGRAVRRIEASGQSVVLEIADEELSRHRSLSVVAVDSAGLASAPATLPGRSAGDTQRGRLFALAVGIDRYPNIEGAELSYAVSDARRTVAALESSPLYAPGDTTVLADHEADAAAIRSVLERIVAAAGAQDTIAVSFAGHGVIDDGGQLRLVLSATSLDELATTSLPFDVVADTLRNARSRVVLFLDVCHAGLSDRARVAANDDVVNRLTTAAGAGMVILSASKARQESQERASAGGGLFSAALERVLVQDRDRFDSNSNGAISLAELYRGIKALVVQETAGRQTPWLSRNQIFGDFDLF